MNRNRRLLFLICGLVFFCISFLFSADSNVYTIKNDFKMGWEGWFTLSLFLITFTALVKEIRPPHIIMLVSSSLLVILGILKPREFLGGFSNEMIFSIAMLCVIARAFEVNGILDIAARKLLVDSDKVWIQQLSYIVPVFFASAFLNNTPIVLLMTPIIRNWALQRSYTPSKYLIPLSYAAIMGGLCTLIGTSTNLVVNGLLGKYSPDLTISFFELSRIGIPIAILGIFYLITLGRRLIPERADPAKEMTLRTKEFTAEFQIEEDSVLANKKIVDISGKYFPEQILIQIERNQELIDSPNPDLVLFVGDRLVFISDIHQIAQLHTIKGLKSLADPHFKLDMTSSHFSEVVISTTSNLIGKTIKQVNFRNNYGASVFAVYRKGWRVLENVGNIVLQPGDTLMLLSGDPSHLSEFVSKDFYVIRQQEKLFVFHPLKASFVIFTMLAMVIASALGVPIIISTMAAAFTLIITRCTTIREAQKGIMWNLLLLIACTFAFGRAMVASGAADFLANILLSVIGSQPHFLVGGILFVTILATEFLTNNAAALIVFPIAMETMILAGYPSSEAIKACAITVAVGSSCGFMIPTGYQTHMIVFGPGGYRFTDFLKVGFPMDVIVFTLGTLLIPILWPF